MTALEPVIAPSVAHGPDLVADRREQRWVGTVWGLLFFSCLTWIQLPTLIPIPSRFGQALTMSALCLALLLALMLNRHILIRPNLVLGLYTVLAGVAVMSTMKAASSPGPYVRCFKLVAFLAVLWLLTPWWGRSDRLIARCHVRAVLVVSASVAVGLVVAPGQARAFDGRLSGIIWPIPPTAVAHYAAIAAGVTVVLWLAGSVSARRAFVVGVAGIVLVLFSHTRIALIALLSGVACAALSLLLSRRRVRRAATAMLALAPLALAALSPFLVTWFARGQSTQDISGLTGRKSVWTILLAAPRTGFQIWFGSGLSNKGFRGRPIDSTWLAAYQDTGLVGAGLVGVILLVLLVMTGFRNPSPGRAVAVFILVYCVIDAYTEVGLADPSTYLLDVIVAASLLVPMARGPDR